MTTRMLRRLPDLMTTPLNSPAALRGVVWIIIVYPLLTIAELTGLLLTADRHAFQHDEILYSAIVNSLLFWSVAYGIANRRMWAWWLGVIVFGMDVFASRLEVVMQGSVGGVIWIGHSTTETAVGWLTDLLIVPCGLNVFLYLVSHKNLFVAQSEGSEPIGS